MARIDRDDGEELHQEPEKTFAALLKQHEVDVRMCILALVPNWADAEDIFQETCLRLLEKEQQWFNRPNERQDFRAWAVTVAYYQVMTYRKGQGRERSRFSGMALDLIKEEQSASEIDRERRLAFLAQCVSKLDRESRQLLKLAYSRGLRLQEIAERLGRTDASTYKLHSRIRMALRA